MSPSAEILRLPAPGAAQWARATRQETPAATPTIEDAVQSARETLELGRGAMQFAMPWTGDVPGFIAHAFVDGRDWTTVTRDSKLYGNPAAHAYQAADRLGGQGAAPLYDVLA
jgi:hypothetical protein